MARKALGIAGLIALLGGIHLATLREGHEWGDDFSLYVAHARNIVEGRAYADTGYIYNPANPILSPRSYPPVFPLLLAPVYALFGLNLAAMKAFVVLLFMALLGVLSAIYCKRLSFSLSLACLIFFALNPYVWQHKDRLLSETPFMLLAYLALLLAERALALEASKTRSLAWGLFAGLIAYLAFGTRAVGIVLIPSVLGCALLRQRRLGLASLSMTAAFAAGVIVQKTILVLDGSYLDQVHFDLWRVVGNGVSLAKGVGLLMNDGHSRVACILLYAVLLGFAGMGYVARLRRGATVYELFAAFYCLLLVLWPPFDTAVFRYLMPILPLWFLYVGEGMSLLRAISFRVAAVAAPALALSMLLSYADWFRDLDAGPIRNGVNTPEAVALFDWIKNKTDPQDIFLFQKPRAFALYTGRRSLAHHKADDPPRLARTLRQYDVTHVVVHPSSPFDLFQNSSRLVEALLAEEPSDFETVYENPGFRVYRLRERSFASCGDCQSSRQSRN
jgi:hypothetical protein